MSVGGIIGIIIAALVLCCCFTHRRVIRALIRHEPMPKAPKWHVWVKPENRRCRARTAKTYPCRIKP